MASSDKTSAEYTLSTRTRSSTKKSTKMVAPHPDDDVESDEEQDDGDLPGLVGSDEASADESTEDEPQPSTSQVTINSKVTRRSSASKSINNRKGKENFVSHESHEPPPLVGGPDSSLDEAPDVPDIVRPKKKKGRTTRTARIVTPPRTATENVTKKTRNKVRVVDVPESEHSDNESNDDTDIEQEPVCHQVRRHNTRRRLTKKQAPRIEAEHHEVRHRHKAGNGGGDDPDFPHYGPDFSDNQDDDEVDDELMDMRFDPLHVHSRRISIRNEVPTPQFDGTNFKAFQLQFLDVCRINGWSEPEKIVRLRCSLVGKAMQILTTAGIERWNLTQWWEEMELRHGQIQAVCDVSNMILEMTKGYNQSALSFADAIESLALKSQMKKEQRDAICYTAFVHGLRKFRKLQQYVMRSDKLKTINSAAKCATWYEREMGTGEYASKPTSIANVNARMSMEQQPTYQVEDAIHHEGTLSTETPANVNPTVNHISASMDRPATGEDLEKFWNRLSNKIDESNQHLQFQISKAVQRLDDGDRAREAARERRQASYTQNNNQNNNQNYNGDGRRGFNNKGRNYQPQDNYYRPHNDPARNNNSARSGDKRLPQAAKVSPTVKA